MLPMELQDTNTALASSQSWNKQLENPLEYYGSRKPMGKVKKNTFFLRLFSY